LTASFRRDGGADTAIVRIFNTYGPRMRPHDGRAVPEFIAQARAGLPITVTGDGSQTRSLCYVTDTVDGVLALAANDEGGPVNIGNPQEISMLELAQQIRRLCGSSSPITFVDLPADDPRRRCPDITLARTLLGWTPRVDLPDGLARTLAWAAHLRSADLSKTGRAEATVPAAVRR
jgi:dTDP-glucose 4,6-dehydratase